MNKHGKCDETKLNAYQITWATFRPVSGEGRNLITKNDQIKIDPSRKVWGSVKGATEQSIQAATPEAMNAKINRIANAGLTKTYEFFVYTDKQAGMRKFGEPLETVLTSKQIGERAFIC
jgi:hypothetical protein